MEAAEDATLEAAIGWLVQTILGSLLIDKLDAWIRRAGLSIDIERLKSEVERVEMVVAAVRGRASGYKPLTRPLARLKELLYDADDVIDELDYYRLQQQVQGVTWEDPEGMHGAERVDERPMADADIRSSSGGKKRSKAWDDFEITEEENGKPMKAKCKYCHRVVKCGTDSGTSVLHNHVKSKGCREKHGATDQPPNPSTSTGDATANATPVAIGNSSSRKRRRTDEESAQITSPNTHRPWNKAEISNKIQELTRHLQDTGGEVSEVLRIPGPNFANSNHCPSTTSDQHLRTSGLLQRKMYGRAEEKESIIKLMREHKSGGVTVLPIVGIGGVGKTALAQLVYNDPDVESQFDHRIWVWVSHDFDQVRLTREMLDFVSQERHEGINCFAKLQEMLKSHVKSKRVLLILDDVWGDMNNCQWYQMLAPFKSDGANGNVILVTTRKLSVAKSIGTAGPIKLGALESDGFWLLFKSCAFGDGNYEGPGNLSTIGRQIAEKLKGNPLAAITAGALLRDHLTIDHWSNILKKEDWKSLGLSGGIMSALKLSYDQLPYHVQQCFSYCSIFPDKHQFLGKDLVYIWISQGFVNCTHLSKRLEEIGWEYLIDLTNMGFFQQVGREESSSFYVICGLMYDFARVVSRTECATINGLQCNKMLPTVQHLSIVTYSAYSKDQHGNIPRNKKFEEKLRNTVTSVGNLRTLVLIGQYDSFFFRLFQDIFRKSHNLRLLQMCATSADFNSLMCSLVNPAHLRYLKRKFDGLDGPLPQVLVKFFHLQVLDVGSNTDPTNAMNNLVNLRHLVAEKGVYSSTANIGSMTSLQEVHDFKVQISSGFEITQLQCMNELVQLEMSQLDNVKTREEAYGAKLRNKEHLEKLHLSWKDTLSEDDYISDTNSESFVDKDEELSRMDDSDPSSESYVDTAREVLEGLEPHMDLKHLQISGYNGTTSSTWLASNASVTSLQTLHLENCGKWQILPSLERLPYLTKLKLSNMRKAIEVSIPSLEELVLVEMPKLERCSCTSVRHLNSSLRVLEIESCPTLKVFDLFEDGHKFEIEQKSWLPGLRKLIMCDCPHLEVLNPLPPSTACSKLLISGVSTLPSMKSSSSETLTIGSFGESSDELMTLDDKTLAFHNLGSLEVMMINGCGNLTSISFEGFSQLISLKRLEINRCNKLLSSHVLPERICEDMPAANCKAFPSLESLTIWSYGIGGKWLPLMLRHAPKLEELILNSCPHITTLLSIEEEENSLSNLITAREDSSGNLGLARDRLLHIPLNPIFSLKKIRVRYCPFLTFNGIKGGLSGFTSLEKLEISDCPKLFSSLAHEDGNDDQANGRWILPQSLGELEIDGYSQETLQLCFARNLKKLEVCNSPELESLSVHSCTALEELILVDCESLTSTTLLSIEEEENSLSNLVTAREDSSGNLGLARDGHLHIPLNPIFSLKKITVCQCPCLTFNLMKGGLSGFTSLEKLEISQCPNLFSSLAHEHGNDDQASGRWILPQSLGELKIEHCYQETLQLCFPRNLKKLEVCNIPHLESLSLHSCTALEELILVSCGSLSSTTLLSIEEVENSLLNLFTAREDSSGNLGLARDGHLHIPLNPIFSLKKISVSDCPFLTFNWMKGGLSGFTSLEKLEISYCRKLFFPSLAHEYGNDDQVNGRWILPQSLGELKIEHCYQETLQLCFPRNLKKLEVCNSPHLESVSLHSCTALEELILVECESLTSTLEGLQALGSLRRLTVCQCDGLRPYLESLSRAAYELCPRLETLAIDDPVLTTSFCKHLTSLQRLELHYWKGTRLTDEEEIALVLLKSLEELKFEFCYYLVDLPAGLHTLPSLKWLEITNCRSISRLPGTVLPLSLEELEIKYCNQRLRDQCMLLATSKLNVKIV